MSVPVKCWVTINSPAVINQLQAGDSIKGLSSLSIETELLRVQKLTPLEFKQYNSQFAGGYPNLYEEVVLLFLSPKEHPHECVSPITMDGYIYQPWVHTDKKWLDKPYWQVLTNTNLRDTNPSTLKELNSKPEATNCASCNHKLKEPYPFIKFCPKCEG